MNPPAIPRVLGSRHDFISDLRLPRIAALAVPLGAAGALAAWVLPHLIRICTQRGNEKTWSGPASSHDSADGEG